MQIVKVRSQNIDDSEAHDGEHVFAQEVIDFVLTLRHRWYIHVKERNGAHDQAHEFDEKVESEDGTVLWHIQVMRIQISYGVLVLIIQVSQVVVVVVVVLPQDFVIVPSEQATDCKERHHQHDHPDHVCVMLCVFGVIHCIWPFLHVPGFKFLSLIIFVADKHDCQACC